MHLSTVSRLQRRIALLLLYGIVAVLIANGLAFLALKIADRSHRSAMIRKYGYDTVEAAYPGYDPAKLRQLLEETWSRPLRYDPYVEIREREFHGAYVNVDAVGFRRIKDQAGWPPDRSALNVFVFGGSTTFGYGVADDETIPSHLQEILRSRFDRPVHVYNFGRANYHSTQERILFEEMLGAGFVPDIAVFIDGVNEFGFTTGWPDYTRQKAEFQGELDVVGLEEGHLWRLVKGALLADTSLGKVLERLRSRLRQRALPGPSVPPPDAARRQAQRLDERMKIPVDRYLANQRMIEALSRDYGVTSLFVWQPVPTYHYDLRQNPFARWGTQIIANVNPGYLRMARLRDEIPPDHFLWCADMLADEHRPVFVDLVHYSDILCRDLARIIADRITRDRPPPAPAAP